MLAEPMTEEARGGEGARSGRPMGEGVSLVSAVETVENGWTPAFQDISSRLMFEE